VRRADRANGLWGWVPGDGNYFSGGALPCVGWAKTALSPVGFKACPERSEGSSSPLERSFEAQEARSAHLEPETLNRPFVLASAVLCNVRQERDLLDTPGRR